MGQPNEIRLGSVIVRVWPEDHYLETVFPDGTKVPAAPEDTDEARSLASDLGYGDDLWRMCLEHELLHTALLQRLGYEHSPTLWEVAHGNSKGIPGKPWAMRGEEGLVLAYQTFKNFMRQDALLGATES